MPLKVEIFYRIVRLFLNHVVSLSLPGATLFFTPWLTPRNSPDRSGQAVVNGFIYLIQ